MNKFRGRDRRILQSALRVLVAINNRDAKVGTGTRSISNNIPIFDPTVPAQVQAALTLQSRAQELLSMLNTPS